MTRRNPVPSAAPAPPFLRAPHPGGYLKREFMEPLGLTPYALARRLDVPRARIEALVRERHALGADTAVRLARLFGTSEQFWLGLQSAYDLARIDRTGIEAITPLDMTG